MLWQPAIIARKSLYTGVLQPVNPNEISFETMPGVFTNPPPFPATAEFPSASEPTRHAGPSSPDSDATALPVRTSECSAHVIYIGESLHNFYGNSLVELPIPPNHTRRIKVTYECVREYFSDPLSMNSRAISVCLVAFGRRLFISGRVNNTINDRNKITLRRGMPLVFRLSALFRSHLSGSRVPIPELDRFPSPKITLDVTDENEITNPQVDVFSAWTGFLVIGIDSNTKLLVRASAVEIILRGRKRMPPLISLPPVLDLTSCERIFGREILNRLAPPTTEWLGMFMLKNELGKTNHDSDVFEYLHFKRQIDVAFYLRLGKRSLVIWCMEVGPVDAIANSGYNLVFCFVYPYRLPRYEPSSISVPLSGPSPHSASDVSREAPVERNVSLFLERIARSVGITPITVPVPSMRTNMNRYRYIRRTAENSPLHGTRVHQGSSSRAPRDNENARTRRTGLAVRDLYVSTGEATPMVLRSGMQPPTRSKANPVQFRAPTTTRFHPMNASNMVLWARSSAAQADRSINRPQASNQPPRQEENISNTQPTRRNGSGMQTVGEQVVGTENRTEIPAHQTNGNNLTQRQEMQHAGMRMTSQNPTQPGSGQGVAATVTRQENHSAVQNGKRALPSEEPATNEDIQPPSSRPRMRNSTRSPYRARRGLQAIEGIALQGERQRLLLVRTSQRQGFRQTGRTGQQGANLTVRPNETVAQVPSGQEAQQVRAIGQNVGEEAGRQTRRPLFMLSTGAGSATSSEPQQPVGTYPARIEITYLPGVPLERLEPTRIPRRNTAYPAIDSIFHWAFAPHLERNFLGHATTGGRTLQLDLAFFTPADETFDGVNPYLRETERQRLQRLHLYPSISLVPAYIDRTRMPGGLYDEEWPLTWESTWPSEPGMRRWGAMGSMNPETQPLPDLRGARLWDHLPTPGSIQQSRTRDAPRAGEPGCHAEARAFGAWALTRDDREMIALMPLLRELERTTGASAEWEEIDDDMPSGYPTQHWVAVELFPCGPFVGTLPLFVIRRLFRENGRDDFDGRGFRFWYNADMFLVFGSRDEFDD